MLRTNIFRTICDSENLDKKSMEIKESLIFDCGNQKLLEELGAILYYQKKDDEAIEIYEKLTKKYPEKSEYKAFLGYLYYELDQFEESIDYLDQSLDIEPDEAFVHFLLGNCYAREGKIKEAIAAYDLAIFLDFDMFAAHLDFAIKYERMGRKKRALREFIAAYEIDSQDEELREKIIELKQELYGEVA